MVRGRSISKITVGVMVLLFSLPAWAFEELTDKELDGITAGKTFFADQADGLVRFGAKGDRFRVDGDVSVKAAEDASPGVTSTLVLAGNAQGNLKSLINVNAVNSAVQVLVNLNVSINSTVGEIKQTNESGIWSGSVMRF